MHNAIKRDSMYAIVHFQNVLNQKNVPLGEERFLYLHIQSFYTPEVSPCILQIIFERNCFILTLQSYDNFIKVELCFGKYLLRFSLYDRKDLSVNLYTTLIRIF